MSTVINGILSRSVVKSKVLMILIVSVARIQFPYFIVMLSSGESLVWVKLRTKK